MITNIIAIGNSKGIRIPNVLLNLLKIKDVVNLEIEKNGIIIKPIKSKPRKGWDMSFKLMHERKEDLLLIDDNTDIEMDRWEWK